MACKKCAQNKQLMQQRRAKAVPTRTTTSTNVLSRQSRVFSRKPR